MVFNELSLGKNKSFVFIFICISAEERKIVPGECTIPLYKFNVALMFNASIIVNQGLLCLESVSYYYTAELSCSIGMITLGMKLSSWQFEGVVDCVWLCSRARNKFDTNQ